jgi:hypothetical protein
LFSTSFDANVKTLPDKFKLITDLQCNDPREDFEILHFLASVSSVYLVISFHCSETVHYRWQAFLKVHIFVNNSLQRWISGRIHSETILMMKDYKVASVFLLQY